MDVLDNFFMYVDIIKHLTLSWQQNFLKALNYM